MNVSGGLHGVRFVLKEKADEVAGKSCDVSGLKQAEEEFNLFFLFPWLLWVFSSSWQERSHFLHT